MRAYAARMLGSTVESDDVVQETFVTAWSRIGELDDGAALKAWLLRILSRRCIDRMRRRRETVEFSEVRELETRSPSPDRAAEGSSALASLARALDQLPEAQRRCWLLREVGNYTYQEIADEMDLPVSTVRGYLARARRKLLEAMGDWR
jgi:RNA polymerase sigma-70 factor (ECF subfamily)